VAVNCAAVPESLLESELFGHGRGAFTGAVGAKPGKFEQADGGTILLDEIGEMPLHLQPKLLRARQEREFQRLGESRSVRVDIRVIATTNISLGAMVERGRFRGDLYYRLNVIPLSLPPLRDRREDIELLVDYYIRRFNTELGKSISGASSETMERLRQYSWPGNIRELQTVIKHAMLHAIAPILLPEFLPPELREQGEEGRPAASQGALAVSANGASSTTSGALDVSPDPADVAFRDFIANELHQGTRTLYADCVKYMECILLTDVLSRTNGNQSQAASILGITRGCLRTKLKAHGIMINSSVAIREPQTV
jgi:transcriptional regulator with GAF, ATPase, and Fis domain